MKVSGDLLNKWSMCQSIQDNLEKRLAIASIITEAFIENNLPPPIMVGGAAIAAYTHGEYGTHDTDFIANYDGLEYEVVSTNDENSKEWALRLMTATYEYLEWSYLHKEAHKRGFLEVVERLQREVKRTRKLYKEMREELSITKHQGMRLL